MASAILAASGADSGPPAQDWFPKAPPLPPPPGEIIRVTIVEELFEAAERVKPEGTIQIADGHYWMPRYFEIRTDNVTLRSESGRRESVVLDGLRSSHGELVGITACSGVTIADLTIQNTRHNGFKINSNRGVQNLTIRNCVIHNVWQRGIKGVKVPEPNREQVRPKGCRIQYNLFYNDRPKQFADDPADTEQTFQGNYIGGIDVMDAKDWTISDNVFVGLQGRTGQARGAIFVWMNSSDCLIERNIIIDCDSGICLGNSHKPADVSIHCTGVLVRNNFITRAPENGILADYTKDCRIVQNTVHDPASRLGRLIRLVHDNSGLVVANNLLSGPPLRNESSSQIMLENNLAKEMTAALVDPARGNLRLTDKAVEALGRGLRFSDAPEDIDRRPRGPKRVDLGAHQLSRIR